MTESAVWATQNIDILLQVRADLKRLGLLSTPRLYLHASLQDLAPDLQRLGVQMGAEILQSAGVLHKIAWPSCYKNACHQVLRCDASLAIDMQAGCLPYLLVHINPLCIQCVIACLVKCSVSHHLNAPSCQHNAY